MAKSTAPEQRIAKLLYAPLGIVFGVLGGLLASALFKQIWKRVSDEDEAPEPRDPDHGWGEVLPAAALQGAIFAGVKAAIDRGGARGFERATGIWPGS